MKTFLYFASRAFAYSFLGVMLILMCMGLFTEIRTATMLCWSAMTGMWFGFFTGLIFWVLEKNER